MIWVFFFCQQIKIAKQLCSKAKQSVGGREKCKDRGKYSFHLTLNNQKGAAVSVVVSHLACGKAPRVCTVRRQIFESRISNTRRYLKNTKNFLSNRKSHFTVTVFALELDIDHSFCRPESANNAFVLACFALCSVETPLQINLALKIPKKNNS